MRRRHLRLVSSKDPTDIFDDLPRLRSDQRESTPRRRQRSVETFARIPHDRALELYRRHPISGVAWVVLIELDRLILKHHGQNPVRFVSSRLYAVGLNSHTRVRALRQLEAAGVVEIERRGLGLGPWVTHLWYPLRD
jgi:hypothetical protein